MLLHSWNSAPALRDRSVLIVALALAITTIAGPRAADAAESAQAWALAAERGDDAALARLYAAIDQHDVAAESAYGAYCLSRGDDASAMHWFAAAAQHGDASAQYALAGLYADGRALPRDAARAVYWYRKAAAQGDAAAQFSLAQHYLDGDGVARDPARGRRWLQRAAAAGDAAASQVLAALDAPTVAAAPALATPPKANPPEAAPAATRAAATTPDVGRAVATTSPSAVTTAVQAWAQAWASKDLPAYFGAYLPTFAPPGMSHDAWLADRRQRIADKSSISISLQQLAAHVDGASAHATFVEHFHAGTLHFVGAKTLRLDLVDGRWLIAAES